MFRAWVSLGFQLWSRSELAQGNNWLSKGLNPEHLGSVAMSLKKLLGQEVFSWRTLSVQIIQDCNRRLRSPHNLWVIELQPGRRLWSVSGVRHWQNQEPQGITDQYGSWESQDPGCWFQIPASFLTNYGVLSTLRSLGWFISSSIKLG